MVRGVVPAVRGGIVAGIMLGLGRALGEAIAVTQVIGNLIPLHLSLFKGGNTLASEIAANFSGAGTPIEAPRCSTRADPARDHVRHELGAQRIVHRFDTQRSEAGDGGALAPGQGRSRRRLYVNRAAVVAAVVAALIAVSALLILVGSVLVRSWSSLNYDFFMKGPAVFGQTGGGIAPAFVGTLMLVAIATAIAVPIGVLIAICVSELRRGTRATRSSSGSTS